MAVTPIRALPEELLDEDPELPLELLLPELLRDEEPEDEVLLAVEDAADEAVELAVDEAADEAVELAVEDALEALLLDALLELDELLEGLLGAAYTIANSEKCGGLKRTKLAPLMVMSFTPLIVSKFPPLLVYAVRVPVPSLYAVNMELEMAEGTGTVTVAEVNVGAGLSFKVIKYIPMVEVVDVEVGINVEMVDPLPLEIVKSFPVNKVPLFFKTAVI